MVHGYKYWRKKKVLEIEAAEARCA